VLNPRVRRWSMITLAAVMTMLLWAAPAQAAPGTDGSEPSASIAAAADCVSVAAQTCRSGSVGAYSDHTIWFEIFPTGNGGCNYKIRDVANSQVVRSGTAYYGWTSTLRNVYSRYRLEMTCIIGGWGTIHGA
jgi:hypothetical protein